MSPQASRPDRLLVNCGLFTCCICREDKLFLRIDGSGCTAKEIVNHEACVATRMRMLS